MYLKEVKQKVIFLQVWIIVLGLLGYEIISFLPDWLGLDSRIFSIPYRGIFLLLCIVCIMKFSFRDKRETGFFMFLVIFFWIIYLYRLFYDTFFTINTFGKPVEEYWLYAVCLGFIPIFAYRAELNKLTLHKAMIYSFFASTLINVFSFYSNMKFASPGTFRLTGNEFLNPIAYGQLGVIQILLSICLFLQSKTKINRVFTVIIIFTMVIGLANVALAGSRGPFLQLITALFLFAMLKFKSNYWGYIVLATGIILLVVITVGNTFPIFDVLIERVTATGKSGNINDDVRMQILGNSWNGFLDAPLFGTGFEESKFHTYPHNLLVEACMTTGIFGGLIMLAIYIYSIKGSISLLRDNSTSWIGLLCIVAITTGLTSGGLWGSFKFWTLITLVDNLKRRKGVKVVTNSILHNTKTENYEQVIRPGLNL